MLNSCWRPVGNWNRLELVEIRLLLVFREEDTTSSMYPRPDGSTVQTQPGAGPKKVDVVCDALRITMETLDQNKSVPH